MEKFQGLLILIETDLNPKVTKFIKTIENFYKL